MKIFVSPIPPLPPQSKAALIRNVALGRDSDNWISGIEPFIFLNTGRSFIPAEVDAHTRAPQPWTGRFSCFVLPLLMKIT